MNYFTPELFVRLQDLKDQAALKEWEAAAARYALLLQNSWPRIPAPLRRIVKQYNLHDAEVVSMNCAGNNLSLTLQLDPPVAFFLVLTYTLIETQQINRSALPTEFRTQPPQWLYDEIGVGQPITAQSEEKSKAPHGSGRSDLGPVFTHNILLSNGWELALKFRKFKLSRPEAILPAPGIMAAPGEATMPQSA